MEFVNTIRIVGLCLSTSLAAPLQAEWTARGDLTFQAQAFTDNAIHSARQKTNLSLSGNGEFTYDINDATRLTISPFFRLDEHDQERSHVDLREFIVNYAADNWELNVGLGKVFWGVAESTNIVDVINQRDAVEGLSAEYKLGQPMINLLLLKDWGEINLYALPGFRERTFAGIDGRPRPAFVVDVDNAVFESENGNQNIDVAMRVSGVIEEYDIGLHAFHGTLREPQINFDTLAPLYVQGTQVGADVQATLESWLLKFEGIYRTGSEFDDHSQVVTGFEYSFFGIADSDLDLGIVSEWIYDDRGRDSGNPFQNDILLGLRFALNDEASTDALIGVIQDLDGGGTILSAETSRRIGDSYRLSAEAVVWADTLNDSGLFSLSNEDYLQVELSYFF